MNRLLPRSTALSLLVLASLICAGCATSGSAPEEPDVIEAPQTEPVAEIEGAAPAAADESKQEEEEVPLAVAESEQPEKAPNEVIVKGSREGLDVILEVVADGVTVVDDVVVEFVFSGKG
jgi:hypothetical protein